MTALARRDDVWMLAQWVADRTGLDFDGCHHDRMLGTVRRALACSGTADARAYVERLEHDATELEELTDRLTVGETYFMREPAHFDLLRSTIAPERLAARPGPLRVWSAGCASGEEPHSVAITLDEAGLLDGAVIVGTDLSERALARGRQGRYGRWSLRRCTDEEREAWLLRDGSQWQLRGRYRDAVQWRVGGLLEGPPGGPFDVVLCRNVLIYLTADAVRAAATVLHDALTPGGWLLVGASDPPLEHQGLERVPGDHGIVYRRDAAAGPAADPAASGPVQGATGPRRGTRTRRRLERTGAATATAPPAPTDGARPAAIGPTTAVRPAPPARDADIEPPDVDVEIDARARCRAALGHLDAGRIEEARREAAAAHYLAPALVDPHLLLAHASELADDTAAAARAYRNAVAVLGDLPADATVELVGEPAAQLMEALIRRLAALPHRR